jgi:hypothetical protein
MDQAEGGFGSVQRGIPFKERRAKALKHKKYFETA